MGDNMRTKTDEINHLLCMLMSTELKSVPWNIFQFALSL